MTMQHEWVKMQEDGRILIPAEIRKSVNLSPGDRLYISIDDDGNLKLQSKLTALKEAQHYFSQFKKGNESVVEEFLQERREAARKEREE